jgi:DNA repair protein SbcC/Rad50
MELRRLRLANFRQHESTDIEFGPGITGIFGPNGSGKTTLLEAMGWAIYGAQAARGDRDSIRRLAAKGRANVEVEFEFRLGGHEYRVTRRLHDAELFQDGQRVANSLRAVTERLEQVIGMTHDEFFNTYFTAQKHLEVLASRKPVERAAFLSQVLGYERLRLAQERVREMKSTQAAELRGMEAGLPDAAGLARERQGAEERLAAARASAARAEAVRAAAQEVEARERPRWDEWVTRRDRTLSLGGEQRMAEQSAETARQEFKRLDKELREALEARHQLKRLGPELEPIARLKQELAEQETLQREEAARQADQAQLAELQRTNGALERRIAELTPAERALATAAAEREAVERRLQEAERVVEDLRTTWVRDRQDAETKRSQLRDQWKDVKEQRDKLAALGPQGVCPTCQRPLGDQYAAVLAELDRQLEDITINGNFFKNRMEQLQQAPPALPDAEAARDAVLAERRAVNEREGELRARAEERGRAERQLSAGRQRTAEVQAQLAARPTGYDVTRHDALRADLTKLEPVALEAAGLAARAERAEALVREAEEAEKILSDRERRAQQLADAVAAEGFSEEQYKAAKERFDRAIGALREAEIAVVETRGDLTRAEGDVREAQRRETERAARERQIAELKGQLRLHHELDRAFSDLRADLNAAMRPEIAELASTFLSDLTDGRYDEVDLTEDYTVTILEDGVPKPVISGGEEDLAALVLRLAISQMIAERAGQPLSLLVLDEIFGSLDEARRAHVLGLLRRLGDRFPQVILITHVEQVREGLDRVIRVEYDAGRGTSVVRDDTATLGAADAGVAA